MEKRIPKMKCNIREHLKKQGISVRKLYDQWEDVEDTPSYSATDNFIRKGSGHLDTAWAICRMAGLSLDEAFVEEGDNESKPITTSNELHSYIKEVIDLIIEKKQIRTATEIAGVLFTFGKIASNIGFNEEGATIIGIAKDALDGRDGDE